MTSSPAGRLGPRCSMNFSPTPNNSGALSLLAMTNWRAGRDNRENLDRNRRVKLTKILGALLLWSALFSISLSLAADLPVVRASYNAIGGGVTPLLGGHEKKIFHKYGISVDLEFLPLSTRTPAPLTHNIG